MKIQPFVITAAIALSFAVASAAFAQEEETRPESIKTPFRSAIETVKENFKASTEPLRKDLDVQREEAKKKLEASRAEVKEKTEAQRADMKQKVDTLKTERKVEFRKIREEDKDVSRKNVEKNLTKYIGNAVERLSNAVTNLENVVTRLNERIELLNNDGKDTTVASALVAEAVAKIESAKTGIAALPALQTDGLQAEKLSEGITVVRESLKNIQDDLKSAKESLIKALREVKGLGPIEKIEADAGSQAAE